jgi:hypothetical protein
VTVVLARVFCDREGESPVKDGRDWLLLSPRP